MASPKIIISSIFAKMTALFGRGLVVTMSIIFVITLGIVSAILYFVDTGTPNTITIVSGPKGSSFDKNAQKYKDILAKEGVILKIVNTEGSLDNLKRLAISPQMPIPMINTPR